MNGSKAHISSNMSSQTCVISVAEQKGTHLEVTLGEAEGVKDAAGVAQLGVGHLVALEDGVLQGV